MPAEADGGQRALRWLCLLLSIIGLGISTYLTVEHYTGNATLACSGNGTVDCLKVTTSKESIFLGVPVAVWGLAFYVGMTLLASPPAFRFAWVHRLRIAGVVGGIPFVIYLVYSELFTIDAICLWCTGVHVVTLLLLVTVLMIDPQRGRARPR